MVGGNMKDIDLKFEVTHISEEDQLKMKDRKMDFGRYPVCSGCGQPVMPKSEYDSEPNLHPGCKDSKRICLREYVESKGGEFDNSKWSFGECKDIVSGDWLKSHKDDEVTIGGA
jgi:hypothetical protein